MIGSDAAFELHPAKSGLEASMHPGVDVVDCDSLDQFWDLVSPIGEIFGHPLSKFIFRGQGNSGWELVPKIYRPDIINKYKLGLMAALNDHIGQFFFEWTLLYEFVVHCDDEGLAIPGDSMEFRKYFEQHNIVRLHGKNNRSWPVLARWDSEIDEDEPPRFGWLSNWISGYPEPNEIRCSVFLRSGNLRPSVLLQRNDYPLAVEQHQGITLERFKQLAAGAGHL